MLDLQYAETHDLEEAEPLMNLEMWLAPHFRCKRCGVGIVDYREGDIWGNTGTTYIDKKQRCISPVKCK